MDTSLRNRGYHGDPGRHVMDQIQYFNFPEMLLTHKLSFIYQQKILVQWYLSPMTFLVSDNYHNTNPQT